MFLPQILDNPESREMDINDFVGNHDAPVEIRFKVKNGGKKKDVMFHCGMTDYPTTEDKVQSNGWCATKKYRGNTSIH